LASVSQGPHLLPRRVAMLDLQPAGEDEQLE
jgi:hypothetical protein